MSLFSIVTVCLNDLQNLIKTAESVVSQEFVDREYIICDGGSTDGTVERLSELGADIYISEPDDGIFHAMNKALGLCSGEFICFLNAGDTFHDANVLSRIVEAIRCNPAVSFFYGDVYYKGSVRPYSIQPSRLNPFTLFRGSVCHQAWFLKADIYRALNGFDTQLKYKGDYDFLCRMINILNVNYMHLPICVVNYKGGGYSEKNLQVSRPEFNIVRRRYITRKQAWIYSLMLFFLDPIRRNKYYQRFMSFMFTLKARRSWNQQ